MRRQSGERDASHVRSVLWLFCHPTTLQTRHYRLRVSCRSGFTPLNGKVVLAIIIVAAFGIAFVVTPMPVLVDKYIFVKALARQAIALVVYYRGVIVITVPFFVMMMGIVKFIRNRQVHPAIA